MNPEVECEIVYYPKSLCLGIQGHPEMLEIKHPTVAYLRDLLNKFMINHINTETNEKECTEKAESLEEVQAKNSLETQDA